MLNGKVFIAWSNAETGKKLACKVRDELRYEKYEGVVGGESLNGTVSIGDKIFSEIDKCHYAIIIVAAKEEKRFSNNLGLEWGYCHHKFQGKEEAFLVNGFTIEDSDLRGMNANPLNTYIDFTNEESINEAAEEIVKIFIEKQQHVGTDENKVIKIIDNWATVEDNILDGALTDIEMAKQILFYSQSAYIFHRLDEADIIIKNYVSSNKPTTIPVLASDYASATLKMFKDISSNDNNEKKFPISAMSKCVNDFLSMIKTIEQIENLELKNWFYVNIYKNLNYMYAIQAQDKQFDENSRKEYLEESIKYGKVCIDICDKLLENKDNTTYALFCQAYMYRNLYKLSWKIGDKISAQDYAEKAVNNKRKVIMNIQHGHFSNSLIDYLEGEYYLSLAEYLKFCPSKVQINGYKEELKDYCKRIDSSYARRLSSTKIIQKTIKRIETKLYIFDFDLTIADSVKISKDAYKKSFEFIGRSDYYREENVLNYLSEHLEDTYNRIDNKTKTYAEFQQFFIDAINNNEEKITLYDDVKEVFDEIREKGKQIAIISNRDKATIEKVLCEAGLGGKIDFICSSSDMPNKRKSADSIHMCINYCHSDIEKVLYLGDSNEDKTIALNAGIGFLRVDRYNRYDEKKIHTLKDLEY